MAKLVRGCSSCWWASLCLLLLLPTRVSAQTQQASCVITTRGSGAEVLDVTFLLECGSMESQGALHIDVLPAGGPSPRDRELQITFAIAGSPEGRSTTVHRTKVLLKEGANSARGTIPFVLNTLSESPSQRMQFWNVSVSEDDRNIESSRGIQMNAGAQYTPAKLNPGEPPAYMLLQRGTQTSTSLLILPDGADIFQLPNIFQASLSGGLVLDSPRFDLARDPLRTTSVRHVPSLPEYWHYYLQFRTIALTADDLSSLQSDRPAAAEAIKQYVAAGGNLIVWSTDGSGRKVVDRWFTNREEVDAQPGKNWQGISPQARGVPRFSPTVPATLPDGEAALKPLPPADDRAIAFGYLQGQVVSVPGYAGTSFFRELGSVGLAASSTYDEAWSLRNMIASVGKPPVWTFCAIILLFGIILGPGLLILTGWIGRRSLLILLVPLVSLGATFAIVSYEVLHEGFGTYARSTAALYIDEESGDAFAWSRQTYFSGWPPREGLTIPNNVYCRPVGNFSMDRPRASRSAPVSQYSVAHEPERSIWTGVLPAREQKQFLIAHPLKTSMPIQVKQLDDKRASVRNLTSTPLPFVVLQDGNGDCYLTENLAPDATEELSSQRFDEIAGTLSRLRSQFTPVPPPELRSLGWGMTSNQSNTEVIDRVWFGSLSEQPLTSTLKPYGFVTMIRNCDEIYRPLKTDSHESRILVTGRATW